MFESDAGSKSERIRARISEAATASFIERGYAATTMRLIAAEAGVSVGNAYYYFPSKDHLVQDLYERVQREHGDRARSRLGQERGLVPRLRIVLETGLETLAPYDRSASGFLTAMIAPDSPINPLASESSPAREMTVGLLREAVDGATHRLPTDIAEPLPDALFVAYLGLVLRWTYDRSPGRQATLRLLATGLRLLALTLPIVGAPGVHRVARDLLGQIAGVRA